MLAEVIEEKMLEVPRVRAYGNIALAVRSFWWVPFLNDRSLRRRGGIACACDCVPVIFVELENAEVDDDPYDNAHGHADGVERVQEENHRGGCGGGERIMRERAMKG